MFHLTTIFNKICEKNAYHFDSLRQRLTHKYLPEQKTHLFLQSQSSKKYLNSQLDTLNHNNKKLTLISADKQKIPRRQNVSENSISFPRKLKPLRNSASTIHKDLEDNQLQLKRQRLMLQLRQVDFVMKSKHQQQYLSRVKRNKTEHDELASKEQAARLVQKMNKQRQEMSNKKQKEILILKQNVQESIRMFKEYQSEKNQQMLKKKEQIERRIADRKSKAFERQKINKISNSIIKQLSSYKLSLPEIYTRFKSHQKQPQPVLITSLQEATIDVKHSRGNNFLENVRQQEQRRVKQIEKKIEYKKNVRSMHLQYAKKQRLVIKSREKQASSKRKK